MRLDAEDAGIDPAGSREALLQRPQGLLVDVADGTERASKVAADGLRVLAVATRPLGQDESCDLASERDLSFVGFLAFLDPPFDAKLHAAAPAGAAPVPASEATTSAM